jgi:hypothetical protein
LSYDREPKGNREREAYERAQDYGQHLGAAYANIHAPIDDQRTVFARYAVPHAQSLAKWIGIESRVWACGLSMFAALGLSVLGLAWLYRGSLFAGPLLLTWIALTGAWLLAYLVSRVRWAVASRKRAARFSWLADVVAVAAGTAILDRRAQAAEHDPNIRSNDAPDKGPAPQPLPYGVSGAGAAELVAAWMRHLGEEDAAPISDELVGSLHYTVAVLNDAEPVEPVTLQTFAGRSLTESRRALVFSAASFSEEALAYAAQVQIPLFEYHAVNGTLAGRNELADQLIRTGL